MNNDEMSKRLYGALPTRPPVSFTKTPQKPTPTVTTRVQAKATQAGPKLAGGKR